MNIMDTHLIGTTQAARMLKVSRRRVRKMIEERRLPAFMIGSEWVIERSTVEQFAETYKPKRRRAQ